MRRKGNNKGANNTGCQRPTSLSVNNDDVRGVDLQGLGANADSGKNCDEGSEVELHCW